MILKTSPGNWKGVIPRILRDCSVHLQFLVPRGIRGTEQLMTGASCQLETEGDWRGDRALCPAAGEEASGSPLGLCGFLC